STRMPAHPDDDQISRVDVFADRFDRVGVPRRAGVLPLAHDGLPAHVRSRLGPVRRQAEHDVRIEERPNGVHVLAIPGLDGGLHYLDVRVGHPYPEVAIGSARCGAVRSAPPGCASASGARNLRREIAADAVVTVTSVTINPDGNALGRTHI